MGNPRWVADLRQAGGNGNIRQGQGIAAEYQRLFGQPVANAERAYGQRLLGHHGAAAKRNRQHIGHPEQGADAANPDHVVGLAGKAGLQAADIAGGAANIQHNGVLDPRQEGGAAHAVGRTRGEAADRLVPGHLGAGNRAVVLGDIERRRNATVGNGFGESIGGVAGQFDQARIQQCRVLSLKQPDPPEPARQRDMNIGVFVADNLSRPLLAFRGQWREHRADADGGYMVRAHVAGGVGHRALVERHQGTAIIFMAAGNQVPATVDQPRQIVRPINKRRQAGRGRQANPKRRRPVQAATLNHRIDEMGRADHHRIDVTGGVAHRRDQILQGRTDTACHVRRGDGLDGAENIVAIDQDRVGIGSADINADTLHGRAPAKTERKSRSKPNARGPTLRNPASVRNTSGAGNARTETR